MILKKIFFVSYFSDEISHFNEVIDENEKIIKTKSQMKINQFNEYKKKNKKI